MSDLTEPLLPSNEFADDSPSFHPCREYSTLHCGRAIYQIQGAANIIKEWPSVSLLKTTWTKVGMIIISVLFVYNFVLAFSWSSPSYTKKIYPKPKLILANSYLPEVFMHIIINSTDDVNVKNQMPYIELLSKSYPDYKYSIIVLFNDTLTEETQTSDEINNEIAMNSLWTSKYTYWKTEYLNNVKITYMPLSRFFADSLLSAEWRYFPEQFILFLVRAVSLWDKGGIAFNPEILYLPTMNPKYQEKVEYILKNYKSCNKEPNIFLNKLKQSLHKNFAVNNIQDIIQRLENDKDYFMDSQYDPTEAEDTIFQIENKSRVDKVTSVDINALPNLKIQVFSEEEKVNNKDLKNKQNTRYMKREITADAYDIEYVGKKSKYKQELKSKLNLAHSLKNIKKNANDPSSTCKTNKLTIEINGNILATWTPCHAFLGNVFNDIFHIGNNIDVKSFITKELTNFCSGVLSSCEVLK